MSHTSDPRPSGRAGIRLGVLACATAAAFILAACQGTGTPMDTGSTTMPSTKSASETPTPVPAAYKPADAYGKAENVPVPEMPTTKTGA